MLIRAHVSPIWKVCKVTGKAGLVTDQTHKVFYFSDRTRMGTRLAIWNTWVTGCGILKFFWLCYVSLKLKSATELHRGWPKLHLDIRYVCLRETEIMLRYLDGLITWIGRKTGYQFSSWRQNPDKFLMRGTNDAGYRHKGLGFIC
jgi:hypothetical protein